MLRGHQIEKLLAGRRLVAEAAVDGARDHARFVLLRAARGHAHVQTLDVSGGAAALQVLVQDARELAKQMFEDFQKAPRRARNWQKELAEDARENERTFAKSSSSAPKR